MGQIKPKYDEASKAQSGSDGGAEQLRSPTGPAANIIQMPPADAESSQSFWVFRCCWVAVLAMHVVIGLAYFAMAGLFAYIRVNENVNEALEYLGDSLIDFFPGVIVLGGINAVLHAFAILYVLFWSVRFRALLFSRPEPPAPVSPLQQQQTQQQQQSVRLWSRLCSSHDASAAPGQASKPRRFAILGLRTHDLELLLDIALQTFQAEKISRLIARVWINRLIAAVIVCNCWFAPLVRLAFRRHHRATIDVIQLVVDSMVDIVYAIAIPTAILYPYYDEFDVEHQTFPFINYYSDAWYINAVAENRQFFITSWLDFVAKMLPGLSLLLRLHQIKYILTVHKQFGVKRIQPSSSDAGVETGAGEPTRFRDKSAQAKRKVVARWLYTCVLLGWGAAVLAVHLHATTVAHFGADPGCLLELRPWGATKYVCVVLEVSCAQKHVRGEKSQIDAVFAQVDVSRVQGLVLSHCPALAVPSTIQNATTLQMLKVYNSTIAEWSTDAALTAAAHPHLQLLYITRTSMPGGTLPDGLLSADFPPTLYDIEFCSTDLTSLPADLDEKWSEVQYLSLELSPGITEAPAALARMPKCVWLSLGGNSIRRIPDTLFANAAFFNLMLMGNPLQAVPTSLGDLTDTTIVFLSSTNVSRLPSALLASSSGSGVPLYAGDSPFCDAWLSTQGASGATEFDAGPFRVNCNAHFALTYMYPLDWEDYWRKANRA